MSPPKAVRATIWPGSSRAASLANRSSETAFGSAPAGGRNRPRSAPSRRAAANRDRRPSRSAAGGRTSSRPGNRSAARWRGRRAIVSRSPRNGCDHVAEVVPGQQRAKGHRVARQRPLHVRHLAADRLDRIQCRPRGGDSTPASASERGSMRAIAVLLLGKPEVAVPETRGPGTGRCLGIGFMINRVDSGFQGVCNGPSTEDIGRAEPARGQRACDRDPLSPTPGLSFAPRPPRPVDEPDR